MKKATLMTILLLFAFFACACRGDVADETTLYWGDDPIVSYGDGGFSVFGGDVGKRLTLENDRFDKLGITVYLQNGSSSSVSAKKGSTATMKTKGGELAAVSICANGNEQAYAITKEGFDALLASDCASITIIDNINNEGNLLIERPVSIYARSLLSVEGDIYYISDKEGELSLGGNVSAKKFACSAPNSHVNLPDNLVAQNVNFYINAKTVNGNELTPGERFVTSVNELSELCALPEYFDPAKETLTLSGLTLTEKVDIPFPCRIKIEKGCQLNKNLTVKTDAEGEIVLFGDFSYKSINIDAPNCKVQWDSPCTLSDASNHFNALSLNGYKLKNYKLGGKGLGAITSATMSAEGRLSSTDIKWTVNKNTLFATVSGVVSPSALRNAQLEFEVTGGEVKIDKASRGEKGGIDLLEELGAYVTVTDRNGKTKKYCIITEIDTKLPVVVIETENASDITDKDNYISAKIAVESDFSLEMPSPEPTEGQIRGRGNSTWNWFDKKPYKLKFSSDVSLLGLSKGKEWVLLANYADKSLIRNYVALESAKVLSNMDCYATQYPVDLFVNGEYMGVYTLGEQIEAADNRVDILQNAVSVDTGFFFEIGGTYEPDGANSFSTRYMNCIEVLEPSGSSFTEKHKTYIKNYFSLADEAVRTHNGYEDFIDIDSLIDWFILTELSYNSDGAMRRSVFMKKDHGGKIEFGPVWDFDIAYGNREPDYENYEAWCCLSTEHGYVPENWMCSLMQDEYFVSRLAKRWNEVKNELYFCSMNAIDHGSGLVSNSAEANFEKWDILASKVTLQPDFMILNYTYEKQIQYLRDFITNRFEWIDGQLNSEKSEQ